MKQPMTATGRAMVTVTLVLACMPGEARGQAPDDPEASTFEMELRLIRAMGTGTDVEDPSGPSLVVDVRRDGEQWERAWALQTHQRHMYPFMGRVAEAEIDDGRVVLTVELLQREKGGRLPGGYDVRESGVTTVKVELEREASERMPNRHNWRGSYELRRGEETITGQADGRIAPPPAELPEGFTPVEPGEHPRVLLRESDLKALRAKAQTPFGKALLELMGREDGYDAVGAGIKYQVTGEQRYARQARAFTERQMEGHEGLYSHRSGTGRPPQHVAMAYDLCRNAWDEAFREEVVEHLEQTAAEIRSGEFFVGGNHHVSSNWTSHIYSALGFIGMALSSEEGPRPAEPEGADADLLRPFWEQEVALWERSGGVDPEYQIMLEQGRYYMYWFHREGVGIGGFHGEIAHYGSHAMVAPLEFAVCYRRMFGEDVSPWEDMELVIPRRMFGHHFPDDGSPEGLKINGLVNLTGHWAIMETGFPLVRDQWQPAALWAWNRLYGFEEPERVAEKVIEQRARRIEQRKPRSGLGIGAASWVFLNYPLDMQPQDPQEAGMPLTWQAPSFGYYGFRNAWEGDDEIILQVFAKEQRVGGWNGPNAGTFRLFGFGRSWSETSSDRSFSAWGENRVMLPEDDTHDGNTGHVMHTSREEDGSGSISIDMSDVYAPRDSIRYSMYANVRYLQQPERVDVDALRAMAVDYSGQSGTPCLLVIVDRIDGGGEKVWNWNLGDEGLLDEVEIDDNSFALTRDGATLRGTFVTPGSAEISASMNQEDIPAIQASGGEDFFFIATLGPSDGEAPEVSVEGEGLDANVMVGERAVRFDGEKVLFSDANE